MERSTSDGLTHLSWLLAVGLLVAASPAHAPEVTGIASWYGWREHGRTMANGRPFKALGLSAASRTLPMGSCIRVTHVANGRSVVVPITDRGPYTGNRILDLSLGAARRLHMVDAGLAMVRIDRLPGGCGLTIKRKANRT